MKRERSTSPKIQEAAIVAGYPVVFGQRTPTIGHIKKLAKQQRQDRYKPQPQNEKEAFYREMGAMRRRAEDLFYAAVIADDTRVIYCPGCTTAVGMWSSTNEDERYEVLFSHECFPHHKYPNTTTWYTDIRDRDAIAMSDWEFPGTLWTELTK